MAFKRLWITEAGSKRPRSRINSTWRQSSIPDCSERQGQRFNGLFPIGSGIGDLCSRKVDFSKVRPLAETQEMLVGDAASGKAQNLQMWELFQGGEEAISAVPVRNVDRDDVPEIVFVQNAVPLLQLVMFIEEHAFVGNFPPS